MKLFVNRRHERGYDYDFIFRRFRIGIHIWKGGVGDVRFSNYGFKYEAVIQDFNYLKYSISARADTRRELFVILRRRWLAVTNPNASNALEKILANPDPMITILSANDIIDYVDDGSDK